MFKEFFKNIEEKFKCLLDNLYFRTQLLGQLRASGFVRARGGGDIRDLNTNSENWAAVKAALCAGIYPNLAKIEKNKHYKMFSQYVYSFDWYRFSFYCKTSVK